MATDDGDLVAAVGESFDEVVPSNAGLTSRGGKVLLNVNDLHLTELPIKIGDTINGRLVSHESAANSAENRSASNKN